MIKFDQYQITTLGEPFKLHRRHQKYWEIRYEQSSGTVLIRCGRLLPNHQEDDSTIITCRKKFDTLNAIKDFINKSINIKIRKGYKFFRDTRSTLPTRKTSEEKIPIAPPETSNLTKRQNPNLQDNTIPGLETNKALHSDLPNNPFIPIYVKIPFDTQTVHSRSTQDSFSSYSQSKASIGKFLPSTQEPILRKPDLASPSSQLTTTNKKKEVNSSQIKEEEEEFNLKSPSNNDFKGVDIEQKRDEFMKKVDALKLEECPFGKPTFGSHGTITTASKWESEDPRGWYISEKLGGIRCLWNGLEMWSKNGTQYNIPDYFVSRLPKSPLDGELYMERGTLSKCMMIVKKKSTDPDYEKEWNNMWFVVYDAPEAPGNFRQRLQALKEYFEKSDGLYIRLHEYRICEGKADAQRELEQIQKEGREGIVLREGNSPYTKGRSKFVLERRSHFEARAEVIEHIKGKSKSGSEIVASLRVRTSDGKEFLINRGITDDIRQHPPAVGSEIIYKFSGELDSGKPKAPVFIKAAYKD